MSAAVLFVYRPNQVIANVCPASAEPSRPRSPVIASRMMRLVDHAGDQLLPNVPDHCLSIKAAV